MNKFVISGDGTEATDSQTGLTWRRCAEGQVWGGSKCIGRPALYTHEAALARATSQADSTGKAWRLPNVMELLSLVEMARSNPAIDTTAFPGATSDRFWSSTPYVGDDDGAWYVSFNGGYGDGDVIGSSLAVRLVRDNR